MRTFYLITLSAILALAITVFSSVPAFARDKNVPAKLPNHLLEERNEDASGSDSVVAGSAQPPSVQGLMRAKGQSADSSQKGIERAMERAARQGIFPPAREKDCSPVNP
jgi:hypothetical protein